MFTPFKKFNIDGVSGFGNGSFDPNICVYIIGVNGDIRGYRAEGHPDGAMGAITPNATYSGIDIYEATWNVVTGDWVISFGDGDTYIDNIPNILITHYLRPDGNTAQWDATTTAYIFNDIELAQSIDSDNTKSCFWVEQLPELIFNYNFAQILTGVRE